MTTSFRKNEVPICGTILWLKNTTAPLGFTHDAILQTKYFKNVLNTCTNPGCTGGSNTHTHASTGTHNHTVTGTHTHQQGTGPHLSGQNFTSPSGGAQAATDGHTHSRTSGSAGSSPCPSTCNGAHTQNSQPNQPIHTEFKYITKNPIIGMRTKDVPIDGLLLWTKALACIPTHYSKDVSHLDRFIKGTATDCVTPGCTSGLATHGHGSEGSHTHADTLTTHGHTYTSAFPAAGGATNVGTTNPLLTSNTHTHTGSSTDTDTGDCCPVSDSKCHDHGTSNNNPAHTTVAILKHNIITMRRLGIPLKASILFSKPLACIPVDYGLQDGTLGTTDTLTLTLILTFGLLPPNT